MSQEDIVNCSDSRSQLTEYLYYFFDDNDFLFLVQDKYDTN